MQKAWRARLVTSMASQRGRWVRTIAIGVFVVVIALYAACAMCVLGLRWIDPPTTTVQIERRLEAMGLRRAYKKRYDFVPLRRIAPVLQHAVISAEDGRFRQHHGFDWVEMQKGL